MFPNSENFEFQAGNWINISHTEGAWNFIFKDIV